MSCFAYSLENITYYTMFKTRESLKKNVTDINICTTTNSKILTTLESPIAFSDHPTYRLPRGNIILNLVFLSYTLIDTFTHNYASEISYEEHHIYSTYIFCSMYLWDTSMVKHIALVHLFSLWYINSFYEYALIYYRFSCIGHYDC